jgi:flagellar biosynthesis chaperone FliJ
LIHIKHFEKYRQQTRARMQTMHEQMGKIRSAWLRRRQKDRIYQLLDRQGLRPTPRAERCFRHASARRLESAA